MSDRIAYIKTDAIGPNPNNPRKKFDPEELEKLAQSIREVGVLQPVLAVIAEYGEATYRLIAGERRWRAAQLAGLEYIPVILKKPTGALPPEQEAEIMLIENLQRKDLDPIEEAAAYQRLLKWHSYTQEALGEKLGVSQSHIANRIRLLELPESVQENISRGIISPSHGKVLAGHKQLPEAILKKAAADMAAKNVPVVKATEKIRETIATEGRPLFSDYRMRPEFDIKPCEGCESRVMGNYYGYDTDYPYCVKPSCYDKKQQEIRDQRERALADRVEKAAKKGQGVVDLDKFRYDQYERFDVSGVKDMDLTGCQACDNKKVAKNYSDELVEACFQPSCFKKKQAAATREKNKAAKTAFQAELEEITVLAQITADACLAILMPRPVLVYLAAQLLANIQNEYERGKTRYQWAKEKFGWTDDLFKATAYHSLKTHWDALRARLETLDDGQLWEIIFEWPAVASGLTGIRQWIFEQGLAVEEEPGRLESSDAKLCDCGWPGHSLSVAEPAPASDGDETAKNCANCGYPDKETLCRDVVPGTVSAENVVCDAWVPATGDDLREHEAVGWILDNSCGDPNYDANIPRLTDEELIFCLEHEDRKTGEDKLKKEAMKRGFHKKPDLDAPKCPHLGSVEGYTGLRPMWMAINCNGKNVRYGYYEGCRKLQSHCRGVFDNCEGYKLFAMEIERVPVEDFVDTRVTQEPDPAVSVAAEAPAKSNTHQCGTCSYGHRYSGDYTYVSVVQDNGKTEKRPCEPHTHYCYQFDEGQKKIADDQHFAGGSAPSWCPLKKEGLPLTPSWPQSPSSPTATKTCDEWSAMDPSSVAPKPKKSYANSSKEIPLPTFAKRAGLPAATVRKMCEKGEIVSTQSYRHRMIPEGELDKVMELQK